MFCMNVKHKNKKIIKDLIALFKAEKNVAERAF